MKAFQVLELLMGTKEWACLGRKCVHVDMYAYRATTSYETKYSRRQRWYNLADPWA